MGRCGYVAAAALAVIALSPRVGLAGGDGKDKTQVDAFSGRFTHGVEIATPPFRGLEPKVSVEYSSSTANGLAGVGWGVGGASVIERGQPGRGAPKWDASDWMYLDGQELWPCQSGSVSPSCTTGGTHSTRIESYSKIQRDTTNNRWYVWSRDGTKSTYTALFETARGTFRWGIATRADTMGSTVTYNWSCDGSPTLDCYLDTITYNGNTIKFYKDTRPDPITFSTGMIPPTCYNTCYQTCCTSTDKYGNCIGPYNCNPYNCEPHTCTGNYLGKTSYRITAIDVLVGSSRVRTFALGYSPSTTTGRSILTSIKQYGTDASVTSTGVVTGNTSLPAMTHAYSSGANSLAAPQPWLAATGPSGQTYNSGYQYTGDFNGDGRTDYMYNYGGWYVALSNGSSLNAPTLWLANTFTGTTTCYQTCYQTCYDKYGNPYQCNPYQCNPYTCSVSVNTYNASYQFTGDFNGDGRDDLMFYNNDGWYVATANAAGTGFSSPSKWLTNAGPTGGTYNIGYQYVGDFNGDGKIDYMYNRGGWYVALSSGGSFSYPTLWLSNSGPSGQTYNASYQFAADLNGDGKIDWMYNYNGWYVALSTGAGFTYPTLWLSNSGPTGPTYNVGYQYLGDFNGDGRLDWMYNYYGWYVALGTGASFTYPTLWLSNSGPSGATYNASYQYTGDLNGDGREDWMYFQSGWYVALSNGAGFGTPTLWLAATAPSSTTCYQTCYETCYDKYSNPYQCNPYNCNPYTCTVSGNTYNAGYQYLGDFNGDGKPDFMYYNNGWKVARSSTTSDLLTTVTNGIGGSTTIAYSPSSAWGQTYLPVGMVFPTVSEVQISDGRGDVQTTNYTYEGAKWLAAEREFLGFRLSSVIQAATGAYSQTYYWQRAGTIAKPEAIYKRKANGAILSMEKFVFTENEVAPYTSLVTQAWVFECNGDGVVDANHNYVSGCRRILTTYEWDQYGNLSKEYLYGVCAAGSGDCGTTGDERTAVRSFAPNTTKYITGMPAYEDVRAGIGVSGTLLARTKFYYDGATVETTAPTYGALTKKLQYNDQTGGYVTHSFAYDAYGNQTSMTDPLGRVATKTYDPTYKVYPLTTTNPLSHTVTTAYNYVLGVATSITDPDGLITTHAYDALGRATLTTKPNGAQVKMEYLSYGTVASQKTRQSILMPGSTWVWEDSYFDGVGRSYKRISQSGVTQETTFGTSGKPWRQTLPYIAGETVNCAASPPVRCDVHAYDELGRELSITRAGGTVISHAYNDEYQTGTDATGNVRTVWFDVAGRQTLVREVIAGVNKDTAFYYDLLGRRTKTVDAAGYQTTATYDSLGRVLQKSDPDQGLWTYTYNDLNQVVTERDGALQTTTLAYDTLGRVTRRTYPNATYDSFTFDETGRGYSKGRLTTAVSASGITTRAWYDNMGRRSKFEQVVDGVAKSISHTYDIAGRVATVTYPDAEVLTYGYGTSGTALGRLVSVSGSVAGSLLTSATYTSKGQIATLAYANGVTTTFTPDSTGERTASVQIGSLATIAYGYDAANRVTSLTSTALADWTYGYDSIGRLTRATNTDGSNSQTFAYDAVGRMTSNSLVGAYAYGAATHVHAVTTAGSLTYAYDANGNLTSGAGRTLTYWPDHRVKTITSGGITTTMTYDAQGLRVKKASSVQTVVYVGSVYELRGTAVTKYYMAGGMRIAKRDANGNSFFHTDHLGSTRLITNASGAEVKRYEYRPYGQVVSETGTRPDSHRYTGHEADDETGLMFFQARYYDPALGRFLQADPLLPDANAPQSLDLYQYANNSPVNYVDPSGHAPVAAFVVAAIEWCATHYIIATIIGTALTFTNNPFLQTIGMIMCGAASAGMTGMSGFGGLSGAQVGAAVALAQSPISPLDPTIKKAIGWAYTLYCGVKTIDSVQKNGLKILTWQTELGKGASWLGAAAIVAAKEIVITVGAIAAAYWASAQSTDVRFAFAFLGRCLVLGMQSDVGPIAMISATYDLAYTLRYPDGRTIDLSGGMGGEAFTFYYHTGYESPMSFGRQHIRVGDSQGGYWELGDTRAGYFGPGLGFAGWITTQKITVIMSPTQAAAFRGALAAGGQQKGGYIGLKRDSYYYISAALEYATGKSAADLHINPGLIHFD